ncbi:MAG: ribonuclease HII [Candidatus Komeilibacteria bacterium]|jgi:ribonuclease HII|nr:ribonuclease HII [Candidatus Komeilibacteria bacterium]
MMKFIVGIDEAGRGPLAGPIVAAAVLNNFSAKNKQILSQVKDSKKLTPKRREDLFWPIIKNMTWSVRAFDNHFIDKYGIQAANVLLFHELGQDLLHQTKGGVKILADYVGGAPDKLRHIDFHKKGEDKFQEIAAASIIAKVYRDRLMMGLDKAFPHYDFWLHKGYGTKKHYENLDKLGPSSIHRRSFLKNYLQK